MWCSSHLRKKLLHETSELRQGKIKNHNQDTGAAEWTLTVHTHRHTILPLFPLYSGYHRGFSMWGIFFRRTDKALPVRSRLAATSHAAQGGSPASCSILPLALPPQHRGETAELWMVMTAGEVTCKQNTWQHTRKHLCICKYTQTLKHAHNIMLLNKTAARLWHPLNINKQFR